MKKVIALLALIMLAVPAFAADIAKDPAVVIDGVQTVYEDVLVRGDAAVVSLIDGTFTDMSGYYSAGLTAAGYSPDVIFDAAPADYSTYLLVIADSADMWWTPSAFVWTTVLSSFSTYMDGGGHMVCVGQDWLYSSFDYAFPQTYLGMSTASEDANYADADALTWTGTASGPLDGMGDSMLPCFASNPWFTDTITPTSQGLVMWGSPLAPGPQEGGCASVAGIFSTVEFGCGGVDVVGALAAWFTPTATEDASISAVKALY